jgi:hypothetical protein
MAHKRLAEPNLVSGEQLAALACHCRSQNTEFADWAAGRGLVHHSDSTQLKVLELSELLTSAGYLAHPSLCFKLLIQLDILCNQVVRQVLQLTQLQHLGAQENPHMDHLRQQPVGNTRRALATVPVLCARLALNRLTRRQRDWFTDINDAGAALEVLQLMLESAPAGRRAAYGSRCDQVDWSALVQDFGRESEIQTSPGPWISPELTGVRSPVGSPTEWQVVHQVVPGERLLVLLDSRESATLQESLRWWHPEDCGLLVPVLLDMCSNDTRMTGTDGDPLVDGSDPAACVCAILSAELELGKLAAEYVEDKLENRASVPLVKVSGADWWPSTDDLSAAQRLSHINRLLIATAQAETLWQGAATAMRHAARNGRASMVTVNRPDPHWVHESGLVMAALDQYFCDITEVNPHLRVRLAAISGQALRQLPAAYDLLGERCAWPLQQTGYQMAGAVVESESGLEMVSVALGNQMGLNLVLLDSRKLPSALDPLLLSSRFARAQAMIDEPAPWLGIPLLTSCDWWNAGVDSAPYLLAFTETLLAQPADQVRVMLIPDANTAMACLKACYGEFGVMVQLLLPADIASLCLDARQAEQLVAHGALCLAGNCAADVQLVACGAQALQVAQTVSLRLRAHDVSHSLVYVLEPGRFRQPRDNREQEHQADASLVDTLFPHHVRQRLVLTDLCPEVLISQCQPLDLGPQRTAILGYNRQYPDRSGLDDVNALRVLADLCGLPTNSWLTEGEQPF